MVLNRVGDKVKDELKANKTLDFILKHPQSNNGGQLLTHILPRHYETLEHDLLRKI